MGFPSLKKITDTRSSIFFSKYSNAFLTGDIPYSEYRKILKVIEEADYKVEYDEEKISNNIFSAVLE